ncbi:t-SNARE [Metschnikowia bicuspidata var. bicuspidata NRRL YB-4993]|uniref:t-SNARE n=1 Tax=Metschnikowia bicuspidata var. bicuspidata NRRL YB-4993 TaxID=869754 RepID=A0A1A0HI82_9ASCO|nr:t-SNARE [Metschnikowia bicuspidata var. bicuspidata NRRL YB-4993]OBA23548.1 t-SNARE [Metschnikowia bicuspidata var. bicuspidata NRRL YB-4993]
MSNPYYNGGANGAGANHNTNSYEMNAFKYEEADDFVEFMNEIQDINLQLDNYSNLVDLIANKQKNHLQDLDLNDDGDEGEYMSKQIDLLVLEASSLQSDLKSRIKNVQTQAAQLRNPQKIDQAETSRNKFLDLIQRYRLTESNNREQTRVQAERQYRIVKPDATPEEIQAVVEDGSGNQQIFQQALMQLNRRGEARTVLNEVQVRHRELLKLEKTMAELTQLFHDMEELVVEQDQPIQQIEQQIDTAQHDIEQGVGHTNKAVVLAKKARKKKIWCFFICIIILCILALILGLYFGLRK